MRRSQKVFFVGALIIAVAVPWIVHWPTRNQMREEIQSLQKQVAEIPQLQAQQEQLSRLLVEATNRVKKARTEQQEVTTLRGIVGSLQHRTNELWKTAVQHFQASAEIIGLAKSMVGKTFVRNSWSNVGYNRPEDTVQTLTWATMTNNWQQVLESGTPRFQAYTKKQMEDSKATDEANELWPKIKEYRITDAVAISPDTITLYCWFEYSKEQDGKHGFGTSLNVKQVDGHWRVDDPGLDDDKK